MTSELQEWDGEAFPHVVEGRAGASLAAYVGDNKSAIDARLASVGAVLFRGFEVPDAMAFDAAILAYGDKTFPYEDSLSNAVRTNVTPRVFTANEAPKSTEIYLHHEMAQTPIYPSKLFFYCERAPASGGATPLCRSDILLRKLRDANPGAAKKFADKGVRYRSTMPAEADASSGQGRSWRNTLAPSKEAAEARLAALGYNWSWSDDDLLTVVSPALPAVRQLADGRDVFFNQLIAACRGWADKRNDPSKSVMFGDRTPILPEDIADAIEIADAISYDLAWRAGDVALVDNDVIMHGRRPFEGPRRVLASLVA